MRHSSKQLLIVDDDEEISALTAEYLSSVGFEVLTAISAEEAEKTLASNTIDLMVLDLMLPGESGLSFCQRMQSKLHLPTIIVSAVTGENERVSGLELGADDYLEKPFSPRELQARISAVLRRAEDAGNRQVSRRFVYRFAGWQLDETARKLVAPDGVVVHLSSSELDTLLLLLKSPEAPVSRDTIASSLRGSRLNPLDRSVDILISRIRKKLAQTDSSIDYISTVRHQGYLMALPIERLSNANS
ncbi:response regulator [Polycladidibacter stylochi]|uniref:response regulator n=1 Tax=Polycladidibacter stylochi TaxID=1807766 RepID=UPI00082ADB32|nr:response regulator transcription factor [Pseudovibrio stylochi]